jgi:hypothetical protein
MMKRLQIGWTRRALNAYALCNKRLHANEGLRSGLYAEHGVIIKTTFFLEMIIQETFS